MMRLLRPAATPSMASQPDRAGHPGPAVRRMRRTPTAASFCDPFAYIVPTMRAKRSQKSARCGSPSRRRSLVRQAPSASNDIQAKTGVLQVPSLLLEILESERMILHPPLRQLQVHGAALDAELHLRQRLRTASAVQQYRQPQQHDQELGETIPRRQQILQGFERQLPAMPADQG